MGIFREVRVVMNDEVSMENSAVHSKVNTETLDEAWLTVETQLTNESEQAVKGQLIGTLKVRRLVFRYHSLPENQK